MVYVLYWNILLFCKCSSDFIFVNGESGNKKLNTRVQLLLSENHLENHFYIKSDFFQFFLSTLNKNWTDHWIYSSFTVQNNLCCNFQIPRRQCSGYHTSSVLSTSLSCIYLEKIRKCAKLEYNEISTIHFPSGEILLNITRLCIGKIEFATKLPLQFQFQFQFQPSTMAGTKTLGY